ncbi:hypothetical protein QBC46DRAFT_360027 [Diplogelasinospora grovesii]|uniref:Uncharacterized protein n=1 Tax=Diplogelasinospora grovesii TaxID=303347 RepID=A0AAN6SAJ8_9PEZI|nr:hypothetical protein QBC46DRAFT_360027 [Diplogelasinospora grovesii]
MDDSGRQSRVTLAPSVYNPNASRRDKRLPHVPTSPWPLPPQNQDALQEGTSPPAVQDGPQRRTQYMAMLLSLDKIPRLHNILVSCFTWILLAGFVVIPGSFNSLRRLEATTQGEVVPGSPAVNAILGSVAADVSVTVVGFAFMLVGLAGACWLGWRWRRNYVWLLNKLYMPVLLNALAGVITTLVNVYAQQRGGWNPQAIVAITVEASVLALSALLFGVYNFWLLEKVKGRHYHDQTTMMVPRSGYGDGDRKSFMARVKEVKEKPSLAPGSVV